ncbi:MAG: Fic family protein [Caldilineaceae bacterium SB0662_bin_25]|nr:Fic family protein [Caldilineaceae bacterium SB0662_bin_25]
MAETRTYQETHPWINFQLDLRRVDYTLWFQLGEVQAKCEQVAGVPLLPDVEEYLHQVFLAKGALATTAIEGNTLSERDALELVRGELELPPSKEYLGQEIRNIVNVCNNIPEGILSGELSELTVDRIKELNALVLHDLPLREDVSPGLIRDYDVGVGRYRGAPQQDCEYLLTKLCSWLNIESLLPNEELRIASGVLKAIVAHLYLAWIHPFGDGNGRTARLVEFQLLLLSGVPTAAAHLLSNHYNLTRTEYYRQLDLASKSGGNVLPFIQYALQGLRDGLDEQLQTIRAQQFHVFWMNHVHSSFRQKVTPTDLRRRQLVVDLSEETEPVPIVQLRYLSPRIAEAYAGKTDRTIRRDVNVLERMDLIRRNFEGIEINRELMSAFLSPVIAREQTKNSS